MQSQFDHISIKEQTEVYTLYKDGDVLKSYFAKNIWQLALKI